MKNRFNFNISMREDDISFLSQQVFLRGIQRFSQNINSLTKESKEEFELLDTSALQKTFETMAEEWKELVHCMNTTLGIISVPESARSGAPSDQEPTSSTDTKVLKDLPDLEEDSLGVDSGSE